METFYRSPIGTLCLEADAIGLTHCRLCKDNEAAGESDSAQPQDHPPAISAAQAWLSAYFSRRPLPPLPPLHLIGTPFQLTVWHLLQQIPYGATTTYGQLARRISPRMSAQAVGQAVGRNPVAIFIPCHRVLAARSLGGYAYGAETKQLLLGWENECI